MNRFYMAAGYGCKEDARHYAKRIADLSGWECTSRWFGKEQEGKPVGANDLLPEETAKFVQMDRDDIDNADVVVVLDSSSSTGGLYWECGYADGIGTPIIRLRPKILGADTIIGKCIFLAGHPEVYSAEGVAAMLMDNGSDE